MRDVVGDGPLLLGGGDFDDRYPQASDARERLLQRCTSRRVIGLPQSVSFEMRESLDRARRCCAAHPQLTLLVRERQSFDIVQRWFDVPAQLCPDIAFGLGPLAATGEPPRSVLRLGSAEWAVERDAARPADALQRGLDLLCSAQVVVTDRLHAHVLATLLGRPHVILDNRSRTMRSTFDTWTSACGLAHWADTADAAAQIADRVLAAIPARR
jgi:exopolysaccharide biosynthesis predicted pyruvyltransferase EpsI